MSKKVNVWDSFDLIDRIQPGSNVSESMSISDCKVLRLTDKSGDGIMTIYQVFEGIYLMYDDFHLRECESGYQAAETVFCIDHCREGAMEQYYTAGNVIHVHSGNVKLDTRVHHQGKTLFPNCHYHGITIGFEEELAQKSIDEYMPKADISLEKLAAKFCKDGNTSVLEGDKVFESIMYPLYHMTGHVELEYMRVKIIEILVFLNSWNPSKSENEGTYIYADQAARIRGVHEFLIKNIDENYTQEYLAERFGLTASALKQGFKQVYGESIHSYVKAYRIQQAALLLRQKPDCPISDIAQMVGYTSHSKFTAAFREQFKITPLEYRNQERNGELS